MERTSQKDGIARQTGSISPVINVAGFLLIGLVELPIGLPRVDIRSAKR